MTRIFIAEAETIIRPNRPCQLRKKSLAETAECATISSPFRPVGKRETGMPSQSSEDKTMPPAAEAALAPESIIATLRVFQGEVPESLARQFADYVKLLLRWNQKISLTTITAPLEILTRHFGESLFGAHVADIRTGRLLDVGSGAGFPGLPIAMAAPEIRATLLEPNVKKAAFLAEACRELHLVGRVNVVRERLEEFAAPEPGFDFVTSRAVRVTADFLKKCTKMMPPGGKLVLWVGQEDIAPLRESNDWTWAEPAKIPGSERRYIVCGAPAARSDVSRGTPE